MALPATSCMSEGGLMALPATSCMSEGGLMALPATSCMHGCSLIVAKERSYGDEHLVLFKTCKIGGIHQREHYPKGSMH